MIENPSEFDEEKCVICLQIFSAEFPPIQVGKKGLDTLINYSERRNFMNLKNYLIKKCSCEEVKVLVHKNCRRDFTDIKRALQITEQTPQQSKRLRSSMEPFHWKTNCFLCTKEAIIDRKHPDRNKICNAATIPFRNKILEHCRNRNDNWASAVQTRIGSSSDLVADDGVYHKDCLTRFLLNWPSSDEQPKSKGRPTNEKMLQWFNLLCIWLEVEADGELYTLRELREKMSELAEGDDVYSIKWLKIKLKERYLQSVYFAEIDGRAYVVCFRDMVSYILNDKWYESRKMNKADDAERIVIAAAKLIMAEIREMRYDISIYPTHNDIVCPEKQKEWMPKKLKKLLEILISQPVKQNSIGQSIVYASRPRTVIPPIQFGIGVEMDHLFGSKWLITELSRLGFSISYDEVTRYKQSVIQTEDAMEVADSFSPDTFTQFVADNVDHNICTLDGKGTFHGMGIISTSTNRAGMNDSQRMGVRRQKAKKTVDVIKNKGIQLVSYIKTDKLGLSCISYKPLQQLQFPYILPTDITTDLLWHTAYFFHHNDRPSWSGFMQTNITGNYPGKSQVNFLPIIDLNPSDDTCIYSTLIFVRDQCRRYNIKNPCITFDQPLWLKAVEIIEEKSLHIVCRLGGFHTLMSFMGSIGTMMQGSGLSECLETIYGANAVTHMLSGKAFSQALRGHFLVEAALVSKLIKPLVPKSSEVLDNVAEIADNVGNIEYLSVDDEENDGMEMQQKKHMFDKEFSISEQDFSEIECLYKSFTNGKADVEGVVNSEAMTNLSTMFQSYKDQLTTKSRTARLWIQYLDYINTIKVFIRAERSGNWHLHLIAAGRMLNLFAATAHINYAKSARLYLQMMLELPSKYPDLYAKFVEEGYHTVRRKDRHWGGLWTDLVIEQAMMRSIKSRGGLTRGRGMSETARLSWIHSMHACADVHKSMTELTNLQHKTSEQHVELGVSRIQRDNNDFNKLFSWFNIYDPFDIDEPSLKSISSGLTAAEEDCINCDQTEEVGKSINEKLDNVIVSNASMKRKDQVRTLVSLKVGVRIENENVYVDPTLLFSRLLVLVEREENMMKYFSYELTPIPTSLFENGMMRKASKSNLAKAVTKDVSISSPSEPPIYVLDGGALLHKVKWLPNSNFTDILICFRSKAFTNLQKPTNM